MHKKSNSLDIFAYFFKFVILVLIALMAYFLITNAIELFSILFSDIEKKYCTYGSIKSENNIVSKFIVLNYPESYGSYSHIFIKDEGTNIYNITIFLRAFEVLKYIYLSSIGVLSYILFNNFSKNEINSKRNSINLLIISIMIIFIPIFLLLRNIIGCSIIDSYTTKESAKSLFDFPILFLLFGLILLFINFNYFKKFKFRKIIYISISALLFVYFSFITYQNIHTLISTISMSTKECEYYELIKVRHTFLRYVFESFDLFGNSWTYLGLYSKLKSSMIAHYIFNILANLGVIFIIVYLNIKTLLNKKINIHTILLCLLGITIYLLISELITNVIILNSYKDQNYPNPNLNYTTLNFNNFYLIYFALFTYLVSFKNYKLKEEN